MSEAARRVTRLQAVPEIPLFEGMAVSSTKLKLTSTSAFDVDNQVLRMDDIVRITVEARISQVHHNETGRGELERVQTAKVLSVEVTPWNPDDPEDSGVFRG